MPPSFSVLPPGWLVKTMLGMLAAGPAVGFAVTGVATHCVSSNGNNTINNISLDLHNASIMVPPSKQAKSSNLTGGWFCHLSDLTPLLNQQQFAATQPFAKVLPQGWLCSLQTAHL